MDKKFLIAITVLTSVLMVNCTKKEQGNQASVENFGTLSSGAEIKKYTISNSKGLTAEIINYGARVVSLKTPDRTGKFEDIIFGFDDLASYERDNSYQGAIVGRYGNRIGEGKFILEGKTYQLDINDGKNHLHGGKDGFYRQVWECRNADPRSIQLSYISPDGEGGYPGRVEINVTYTITDNNELKIEYSGKTDKTTILNPTSHCYFNLSGFPENSILNHDLMINANYFTPVDAGLIPTGEIRPVASTPMDFRTPKAIGKDIEAKDEQILYGHGYDHNWVLNDYSGQVRLAATLYEAGSGRLMEVLTDQPGLQFYSGNFLDGSMTGKGGVKYNFRTALCLEAQAFPDSPNKPNFPSVVLRPGEEYKQITIYRFSTK
ncbi:MAG TPA: aldose epimerase family protein [Candidatus Marinimicrobia bacterium]|nr:aldose epimerase family protein [Candidatus Neomarinimicrobiota bacterium]HRS51522.1 aldose epimerase family protein [Candidatus Neomarinimicrobiota bacterium]